MQSAGLLVGRCSPRREVVTKVPPSKEGLKRLNNLKETKRNDFSTYAKMIKLMINEGDSSRNPESRQLANKMLVDYDKFSVMKLAKGCWLFDEDQYAGYKFTQTGMKPKAAKKEFHQMCQNVKESSFYEGIRLVLAVKKPTEVGSEEGVSQTKKKKGDKADIANVFQSAIGRSGNKQLNDFAGGIFC